MGLETIMETVNSELFGVWFLIGAVLVSLCSAALLW